MIFRLIIVVAALIVLAAVAMACIATGRRIGRAEIRRQQTYIDPDTYHRLGNLARGLLAPPPTIDDFVVLPEHLKIEAENLIKKIGAAPRRMRQH